ncbi:MAG TPA: hypothetical protein VGD47_00320 [Steroidobacteraceae bacterium]
MPKCRFTPHLLRRLLGCAAAATLVALPATSALADVTETKAITFDVGIVKINSTESERLSGDKQRTDTDTRCEGFLMSMICGDMQGGDIIRLDKNLKWQLDPKKKTYMEQPLPTPEQRAEAQQKMAEIMEKLKNCPATPQQPKAPDTAKCEMSPPKIDVKKTDETLTLAGHQARRTTVALTQSCTNKETGDSCDFIYAIDSWLTQDEIPGAAEKQAFQKNYFKKLGLDETLGAVKPQMQQFIAPYADALRKAGAKAGDLKGYPLKVRMSVAVGGEHCAAARQRQQSSSGTGGGGSIAGSAASAVASQLSGLFAKKPAKPDAAAAEAGNSASLLELTFETTAISSDPVASDQFDIPAGWKLSQPKPVKEQREVQCPKGGG